MTLPIGSELRSWFKIIGFGYGSTQDCNASSSAFEE
jgi:hypothetical protein